MSPRWELVMPRSLLSSALSSVAGSRQGAARPATPSPPSGTGMEGWPVNETAVVHYHRSKTQRRRTRKDAKTPAALHQIVIVFIDRLFTLVLAGGNGVAGCTYPASEWIKPRLKKRGPGYVTISVLRTLVAVVSRFPLPCGGPRMPLFLHSFCAGATLLSTLVG
jgi:hypothetical protein